MIDALNELSTGGKWVKLKAKGDKVTGKLLAAEWRDRTNPSGEKVFAKSGKLRRELILTLACTPEDGEDDGIRKVPLNESGQRAVREAGGREWVANGTVTIGVTKDPEDSYSQATYKAKYEAPAVGLVDLGGDEDSEKMF